MQLSSVLYRRVTVASVFALLTTHAGASLAAPSVGDADLSKLVSQLYGRYAWIAIFATAPPSGAVPLAQASKKELVNVFAPDLAQEIWQDAQCAQKRREICILDFDILFGSQDPSASELAIQVGTRADETQACFRNASGSRECLTFLGARVNGASRVADIVYPGQRSLRHLMGLAAVQR